MDKQIKAEIAERLAQIAAQHDGRLRPEDVIDDARDADSPLHSQFQWDKEKASLLCWMDQARELISSVRIITHTEHMSVSTVCYVRDPSAAEQEQGYVSLAKLRTDVDLAREAILYEFSRAAAALRRAREIAAALQMSDSVDALLRQLDIVRDRAQVAEQRV